MKIIDNFLSKEAWSNINDTMLTANFPWYLNRYKTSNTCDTGQLHEYQFTHTFYNDFTIKSQFGSIIEPILEKLNPSAIVRIKANLLPNTPSIEEFHMHKDFNFFDGLTAIYYVNTNNGYTLFGDGTRIESIANRCVIFDARLSHTGTTCSDQRVRSVINLNYYTWTD